MTGLTIQDAARRSGLSEPTLRYYEEVDTLQMLACLRVMGVGIEEMRIYQANRELGHAKAGEQRDLLLVHAKRVEAEIETLRIHLEYLRAKAALWDARDHGDGDAEAEANLQVQKVLPRLEEVVV